MKKNKIYILIFLVLIVLVFTTYVSYKVITHKAEYIYEKNEIIGVEEFSLYVNDSTVETKTFYKISFNPNFKESYELKPYLGNKELAPFEVNELLNSFKVRKEIESLIKYNVKFEFESAFDYNNLSGTIYVDDLSSLDNLTFVETKQTYGLFNLLLMTDETIVHEFSKKVTDSIPSHKFVYLPGEWYSIEGYADVLINGYKEYSNPVHHFSNGKLETWSQVKLVIVDVNVKPHKNFQFENFFIYANDVEIGAVYAPDSNDYFVGFEDHIIKKELTEDTNGYIVLIMDSDIILDELDKVYIKIYQPSGPSQPVYIPLHVKY